MTGDINSLPVGKKVTFSELIEEFIKPYTCFPGQISEDAIQ
jgi:hypothetical protein